MMQILAISPLITVLFLIIVCRWSPLKAMASALFVLLFIVIFVWQMHYNWIFAASIKGFLFALEIGLIIIGAIFFLSVLKNSGFQEKIKNLIHTITPDRRVQVIVIGWAFTALIEGSAGFGTPAILASAMLITLGFPVIAAVTLSLIGAGLHSSFGAVGTPVIIGFGAGLEQDFLAYIAEVTKLIAFYNIFFGFFVCLAVLLMLVFVFGKKQVKKIRYILEMIPFLIIATLLVTLPAWFLAYHLGPELPSLAGGLVGLFLLLIMVQKSWFVPATYWDFGHVQEIKEKSKPVSLFEIFKILLPYFFLASVIFITRADFFPLKEWLTGSYLTFSLSSIFETKINFSFSPFHTLGTLLFLSGALLALFFHQSAKQIKFALQQSLEKAKGAIVVLIIILIFVQIFIHSDANQNNYQSLPIMMANTVVSISGSLFPIFVPLIGALGSFITGSTTVSNLLFGDFQANSAVSLGADPVLFLSLQSIGATLGNMIALHNIIVVLTVVGQPAKVNEIIKYNILIVLLLCLLLGLTGFLV